MAADPSLGVILSGGASYGAYEVGVLNALVSGESPANGCVPLDPGVITGTSTGAFNAALFVSAAQKGAAFAANRLEEVWLNDIADSESRPGGVIRYRADPRQYLNPVSVAAHPLGVCRDLISDAGTLLGSSLEWGGQYLFSHASLSASLSELLDLRLFISSQPLIDLVSRVIDLVAIQQSDRQLRIAATGWDDGIIQVFENAHLIAPHGHNMILASTAVPAIFPAQAIRGRSYVDGGVVMNTPLSPAIDAGVDVMHVISVNPSIDATPAELVKGTVGTLYRAFAISLAASMDRDIEIACRLNEGIRLLEMVKSGNIPLDANAKHLALALGSLSNRQDLTSGYRPLTIHRHAMVNTDTGFSGFLDFRKERLMRMIEQGIHDARNHDCQKNRCVIPRD